MTNRTYSGAYSRRRYSNMAATTDAAGSLQADPNASAKRRYTIDVTSANPTMGIVTVTIISEPAVVNVGNNAADFAALGSSATYPEGTVVEVWAKPKNGYRFTGWSHNLTVSRDTNPMRFTLTRNVVMKANFAAVQTQTRTINVNWNETMGRVQADGLQNGQISGVSQGATVTLNANPNAGYRFVKWTGGPSNGSEKTAHYTFQANANYNITAVFAKVSNSPVDLNGADERIPLDDTDTPASGGTNNGTTTGTTTGTFNLKAFVKKWWWAIAIVAYVAYKEVKGGES